MTIKTVSFKTKLKSLINVTSRKWIKPSTPTPNNHRKYKISLLDETIPTMNSASILHYPFHQNIRRHVTNLETSLSQILPKFYPFAGRYIKDDKRIDCTDEGAELVQAQVDCELCEIIGLDDLNDLLPVEVGAADEISDPIMSVQINKFRCGGVAIATCISHRIADAATLHTFLLEWAKASRGSTNDYVIPNFDISLYFPGQNLSLLDFGFTRTRNNLVLTKRILFGSKAISTLRNRVSRLHRHGVSRALLVTSFLTEALMRLDRAKHGQQRGCVVRQVVNMRERTVPPLSRYTCGNAMIAATMECSADETESMDFERRIHLLCDAVKKTVSDCEKLLLTGNNFILEYFARFSAKKGDSNVNYLQFTDLSKFGFYQVDFGFGKPIWATVGNIPMKNLITLMSTRENDGIEAWVHLPKDDMAYFEEDDEIKLFSVTRLVSCL